MNQFFKNFSNNFEIQLFEEQWLFFNNLLIFFVFHEKYQPIMILIKPLFIIIKLLLIILFNIKKNGNYELKILICIHYSLSEAIHIKILFEKLKVI